MIPTAFSRSLSEVAAPYSALLCDVWGVLHNGLTAYPQASQALVKFREETGSPVVLITNAPRVNTKIIEHITSMGIPQEAYDGVVTSGDVVRLDLITSGFTRIYHIGLEKNHSLFSGLEHQFTHYDDAEIVVCTGLNERDTETPENYRGLFEKLIARGLAFVCANPDIVAEHGDRLVYCAGALAQLYAQMGGRVVISGKPHAPIYDACLLKLKEITGKTFSKKEVLTIGDGLPTDITGAQAYGLDALFVCNGIHAEDFGSNEGSGEEFTPELHLVQDKLRQEGLKARALIPRLI
ncbi:TIGR01459 family HAD-type hydrolase [Polycladidibacter stylochi]|uniref:TIGR01459 family HAD-type hydrolase n=1 Tax=Polycladidibacter stylochi TaxID=1807766 RepID=UPI0008313D19|nr:TIGR01459 family HAD-type hydrolase [Pseudovibrio stylochi]